MLRNAKIKSDIVAGCSPEQIRYPPASMMTMPKLSVSEAGLTPRSAPAPQRSAAPPAGVCVRVCDCTDRTDCVRLSLRITR
ncbi:hypothetical protein QQF64_019255 [Cirrhinus molitorella]|uniref:Uncharacterized protein n=1 Tax=Cirrhinus molitorella TaxID=172907 RepID=A0ABR3LIA0_9TELE